MPHEFCMKTVHHISSLYISSLLAFLDLAACFLPCDGTALSGPVNRRGFDHQAPSLGGAHHRVLRGAGRELGVSPTGPSWCPSLACTRVPAWKTEVSSEKMSEHA